MALTTMFARHAPARTAALAAVATGGVQVPRRWASEFVPRLWPTQLATALNTRDTPLFGVACAGVMGEIPCKNALKALGVATGADEQEAAEAHVVNMCRVSLHSVLLASPADLKLAGWVADSSGYAGVTVEFPTPPHDKWIFEVGMYKNPATIDEAAEQGKAHAAMTATDVAVCAVVVGKPSMNEKHSMEMQWHRRIPGGWYKFSATTYYI